MIDNCFEVSFLCVCVPFQDSFTHLCMRETYILNLGQIFVSYEPNSYLVRIFESQNFVLVVGVNVNLVICFCPALWLGFCFLPKPINFWRTILKFSGYCYLMEDLACFVLIFVFLRRMMMLMKIEMLTIMLTKIGRWNKKSCLLFSSLMKQIWSPTSGLKSDSTGKVSCRMIITSISIIPRPHPTTE